MAKRGFNIRIVLEWFYAVVTLERWVETLPRQIGLDVESGDATNTPIGYEEIYYSSGEAFWGDTGRFPSRSEND